MRTLLMSIVVPLAMVVACGGSATDGGSGGGASSTAQAGSISGGATYAGEGGVSGANECKPPPLDCTSLDCERGPDDASFSSCSSGFTIKRYASECDGVVIVAAWQGRHAFESAVSSYTFDAEGQLVGYAFSTDVAHECPNEWGTPCDFSGEPEVLCDNPLGEIDGAGGQGGAAGEQGGTAGGQDGAAGGQGGAADAQGRAGQGGA